MITGAKTKVRGLEKSDIDKLVGWRNDRSIQDMLIGWHFPVTVEQELSWFEKTWTDQHNKRFAIEADSGDYIGNIGLYDIDWVNRQCGFGIFIGDPRYRGGGYAFDAGHALLDFAFNDMDIHRVWVEVLTTNEPSRKYFERLGFKHEGILREHNYKNGKHVNQHIMGLLKDEFA
ncbi:MAG: GNAT family N-acetyltransferase [Caldiserica bacterium]|nr:GNAT family N-acetyltransferase [Caldisericota bacterium]